MRRLTLLAATAALFFQNTVLFASDWPLYGGPNTNGISSETGINKDWKQSPPKQLWSIPLSDDGYAGPSVWDNKVFIVDHNGDSDIVKAINIATGKQVWQYVYKDADKANYGFSRCTPVISNGKVYTISRLGNVNCLNAKTGAKIWSRNICNDFSGKRPTWDYSMSAFIDNNKLIVIPGGPDAAVAALERSALSK